MGLLGAIFGKGVKKKTTEISAEIAKKVNRDLVQGTIYGCFYVACADGELEEAEIKKIEKLIANEPLMNGFGAELSNLLDAAEASYTDGGPRIIKRRAKQELEDLKHDPEQADIAMTIMATIADLGGIGEAEQKALTEAAQWLNLNVKDYL